MLTSLDFLDIGSHWVPDSEHDRITRYEQNRLLFEGKHDQVFDKWVKLLRDDNKATLELILNWNKRISTLWADLLLGEPPRIKNVEAGGAADVSLNRLINDNQLISVLYEVVLDVSRYGTGLIKVRYDKKGIIEAQPPNMWFPVVNPSNLKEVTHHVLAWTYETTATGILGKKAVKHLKVEIHTKGAVEYREYIIADNKIKTLVASTTEATGIDDFLIIPINNITTSDQVMGMDDYSDLDSVIQELEIRMSQVSRILDKHADPNMYGDETALEKDTRTGQWVFRGGGKFFPVTEGGTTPGYVTWDGQLEASFTYIEKLMEQLYFLSATSPASFGQQKLGLAESGSALRRLMLTSLAKVNRLRLKIDPAVKHLLEVASELEVKQGMPGATLLSNITIEWQEGIPQDIMETVTVEAKRINAGLTSTYSALKRLDGLTDLQTAEEIARINTDRKDGGLDARIEQ